MKGRIGRSWQIPTKDIEENVELFEDYKEDMKEILESDQSKVVVYDCDQRLPLGAIEYEEAIEEGEIIHSYKKWDEMMDQYRE